MQRLALILLIISTASASCDSTCLDLQCALTSPYSCLSCADYLYQQNNTCQPLPGLAVIQLITGSFTANSTQYVTSFIFNGTTYYSPISFASMNGINIGQTVNDNLKLTLDNLPPHFEIDVRFSVRLSSRYNTNIVCPQNYIEISWSNGYFTSNIQTTTQVINKTITHSATSDIITLKNAGDNVNGSCLYFVLKDATVIVALCPANCLSCTSRDDCSQCISDATSGLYYWDASSKTCSSFCSQNYYDKAIPAYRQCDVCHSTCYTCSAPLKSNGCTSCPTTTVPTLQTYLTPASTCKTTCPSQYYPNTSSLKCQACEPSCFNCSGPFSNQCLSCGLVVNIQYYLNENNKTCAPTCSQNYYLNGSIFICDKCDVACLNCSQISSSTSCSYCNEPAGYNFDAVNSTSCILGCLTGFYVTGSPKACQPCDSNCRTCINSSKNCLSCPNSSIGGQMFLTPSKTCSFVCPSGAYLDSSSSICVSCHIYCLTCWGTLKSQCSRCNNLTDSLNIMTIYYLVSGKSTCSATCIDGQFIDSNVPNYCQLCSSSCLTCTGSATNCVTCQLGTYYLNANCFSSCAAGYYASTMTLNCQTCTTGCRTCTDAGLNSCQSCTGLYFLEFGTTQCSMQCPSNQYANSSNNSCLPCSILCDTCITNSTNCVTCSLVNLLIPVYLFKNTCLQTCPNGYFPNNTNTTNRLCSACSAECTSCWGSASNCSACGNVTVLSGGVSKTTVYYKNAMTSVCQTSCNLQQFINLTLPNICSNCDSVCTQCKISASNCQSCISGYYLYSAASQCLSTCPKSFYNNPDLDKFLMTFVCSACSPECLACYGPSNNSCTACTTIVDSFGQSKVYFKQPTLDLCDTACPLGYFGNSANNLCEACQNGCVSCKGNASYCSTCSPYLGVVYFFDSVSSSCFTVCPNGGSGNQTDYLCYKCKYFTYKDRCIQSCPSGFVGVIADISTCVECSSGNSSCNKTIGFQLQSKVINNGKSFQHRLKLQEGLSSKCTPSSLLSGLSVSMVSGKARLLLSVIPLTVQNLQISSDLSYITIVTNFLSADITNSSVAISFRAGALISSSGSAYNQLTTEVSLTDPTFMYSYIQTFSQNNSLQAQGITFVLFSFLLLLFSLFAASDLALNHQCMNFVQLIQIYGLSRIRPFPFSLDFYNFIFGFSHYELSFLPNVFSYAFPSSYSQTSIDSIAFATGTQNIVLNFGSIFQAAILIEIALLIFYLLNLNNIQRKAKFILLQENLIVLWSVILFFGSIVCLLSTQLNDISSDNLAYAVSVMFAFAVFVGYCLYFVFWVRKYLQNQLFKVNSVFRLVSVVMLVYGNKFALIFLNLEQILFLVIGLALLQESKSKMKKALLILQTMISMIILNSTFMQVSYFALSVTSAVCFSILAAIRMVNLLRNLHSVYKSTQQSLQGQPKQSVKNESKNFDEANQKNSEKKDSTFQNMRQQLQYSKMESHSTLNMHLDEKLINQTKNTNIIFKEPEFDDLESKAQQVQDMRVTVKRRVKKLQPIEVKSTKTEKMDQIQVIQLDVSMNQSESKIKVQFPQQNISEIVEQY